MAIISPVNLRTFEGVPAAGRTLVQVNYTLTATRDDAVAERSYREVVQRIGDDTDVGPGEDGTDDQIPGGTIWDGTVTFTTSQVAFTQSHEKTIPSQALDEDGGILVEPDEIRARVTLTPLPPAAPSRESNLVRLHPLVLGGA